MLRLAKHSPAPKSLADLRATQSEDDIQIAVMKWWAAAHAIFNVDTRLLWHTPNGGQRGARQAARFKQMGVRAGVPDLFLAVPMTYCVTTAPRKVATGCWHGLFVELKKPDGRVSPEQREIHALLEARGYAVMVAWSYDEAVTYISNYLSAGDAFAKGGKS